MTKRLERKISVDVSFMNDAQKKRVEDCFFKLGYVWGLDGERYDVNEFTNTHTNGILGDNLMYNNYGSITVPPVTLEELEKIVAEFIGEGKPCQLRLI